LDVVAIFTIKPRKIVKESSTVNYVMMKLSRNIFGHVTELYRRLSESKSLHPLILEIFYVSIN